jgi:hypothetical protein
VARHLGMSPTDLLALYRTDYEDGYAEGNIQLAEGGYQLAMGRPAVLDDQGRIIKAERMPDKVMMIFLHKVRLGAVEPTRGQAAKNPTKLTPETPELPAFDLSKLTDDEFAQFDALRQTIAARKAREAKGGGGGA